MGTHFFQPLLKIKIKITVYLRIYLAWEHNNTNIKIKLKQLTFHLAWFYMGLYSFAGTITFHKAAFPIKVVIINKSPHTHNGYHLPH